jgi:hypothetical protein
MDYLAAEGALSERGAQQRSAATPCVRLATTKMSPACQCALEGAFRLAWSQG